MQLRGTVQAEGGPFIAAMQHVEQTYGAFSWLQTEPQETENYYPTDNIADDAAS